MPARYRYSIWDGTQDAGPLDPDQLLDGLSDDLMNFGDLQHALRNLLQRGMRNPMGDRTQGLRDLLQQLRQQRRQQLDRFDLGSIFDQLREQLDEILDMERGTIDQRLRDAGVPPEGDAGEDGGGEASDGESGEARDGEGSQPRGEASDGSAGEGAQPGEGADGGPSAAGGQGGQSGAPGEFADMLRSIADRKREFLDDLPDDAAGQVRRLQDYEFMDPEARAKFDELVDSLRQSMMDTFFKDLSSQIANMSPEDIERLKNMTRDLNRMLEEKMAGGEPDFGAFMRQYGDLFGDDPPRSLEELLDQMQRQMGQMQSLLGSLPPDLQQQLQDLLSDKIGDPELQQGLNELARNLEFLAPSRDQRDQYPFRGEEQIDLQAAMELMRQMQSIDELERQIERTQYGGELDDIDADQLEELLGPEARETLDELRKFLEILEEAGYVRRKGSGWELTPRGTRRIGQRALVELYAQLKAGSFGKHETHATGHGGERTDDAKPYEFGDPFHLDIRRTIMNSIEREGPGAPVRLRPDDFEVARSERVTQTATVIMLDLSWSMALRGSFQAAKKVALALNNLISAQFQRDSLYIIGFSAYARELKAEELPYVRWDESVLGTNMHHALMIAERLLARHTQGDRQVIMISDGEPTAHLERGRSYFAYPPSPVTIRETLKAVKRCTRKGITINTFMLDRNHYLKEFVNQVARINKGRVFYTTPDKLGEYILVDYVAQKRQRLAGLAS